jgi:DNA polymerase III epsilon subunit-like protein
MKVLVFDTETSGLPIGKNPSIYETNKWPHILQLSYIIYDTEKFCIDDILNSYVILPEKVNITPESIKVHNITKEICNNNGIDILEALVKFRKACKHVDVIVGHNVSFDKRMMIVEGIRNKIFVDISSKPIFCTMKNSVNICKLPSMFEGGDYKFPKLVELYKHYFNIDSKNAHDAFIDNLMCLRCYVMMSENIDISKHDRNIRRILRNV